MPKEFGRNKRVADLVQREIARLIQQEMTNPYLGLITVSTVNVSPDLKNAKIYITSLGADANMDEVLKTLNEKAGHFRYELAKLLTLRGVPKLTFVFDSSIENGSRISSLIDSLQEDILNDEKDNNS